MPTALANVAQAIVASGGAEEAAPSALLRALLRAADLDQAAIADAQEWLRAQGIPELTQLRGDPAAKRVLWPRLRALRRQRERQ
jgi:DNA polymerase III psi subunit